VTILVIQPRADSDLAEIDRYSFENFGAEVAEAYMDGLESAFDRLLAYPESGPVFPGIRPQIRYLSSGKHRIFYDYDGQTISVVRILHQAQVPEDHL